MAAKKNPANEASTPLSQEDISGMNVYQKLSAVRLEMLGLGTHKSGTNMHAEFTYFELVDIVPMAEVLFAKYHLLLLTTFNEVSAEATVVDMDDPEELLKFKVPLHFIAEPGKFRMNEVQGVGAAVTYYRRYLYMLVLDLVEADAIDGLAPRKENGSGEEEPPAKKPSKPATAAEREAIREELTEGEQMADEESVGQLKALLKKLLELDPEQENFVQEVALKTSSFQTIKATACEALIENVQEMIEGYDTGEEDEEE